MKLLVARRLLAGLGAVVTAGAVTVSGTPAQAAEIGLSTFFDDVTVAAGSPGVTRSLALYAADPASTADVTIVFDTTGVAGVARIEPQEGEFWQDWICTPAGALITCVWRNEFPAEFDEGGRSIIDVTITPTGGVSAGAAGTLKTTVTAAGATHTATSKVTIGDGVNLATATQTLTGTGAPGSTVSVSAGVRNLGERTAEGVVLWVSGEPGLGLSQYGNCQYMKSSGGFLQTYCEFDDDIAPGSTYRAELGMELSAQVFAPSTQYGFYQWMTPAEYLDLTSWQKFAGITFAKGTGAALPLNESSVAARGAQVDTDPSDNTGMFEISVTGQNSADLEAIGTGFDGAAGESATAQVGIKNNGPAMLDGSMGGFSATAVRVTVPAGTTVTEVDEDCNNVTNSESWEGNTPGGTDYFCYTGTVFTPGQQALFDFTFHIDEKKTNATGSVIANDKALVDTRSGDTNAKNDVAYILVNGDGTLPLPGGEGGEGGQGGGTGGGGTLPVTGVQAGLIGTAGAVLLVLGAGAFLLARRRRTSFVA
ncbi:LPXTG cell wall anchor domain-containing protein [Catenuloplanes sp. NPDC051500]|uniref:LPXTG cell wall anchor domain-containing protein n=1 Tax=Catenuloplanes sp. NPDC051500 TaxID=3363959 RepID=UPI0037999A91